MRLERRATTDAGATADPPAVRARFRVGRSSEKALSLCNTVGQKKEKWDEKAHVLDMKSNA